MVRLFFLDGIHPNPRHTYMLVCGGGGTNKKLSWGEGTYLTMGMNKSKTNDKQGK